MTIITHEVGNITTSEAILPNWWREVDQTSFFAVVILLVVGCILSFTATPPLAERLGKAHFALAYKHVFYAIISLLIMWWVSTLKPKTARRLTCIIFVGVFVALVILPLIGTQHGKGSTRWLSLGFYSFQPSEFLKPSLVVVSAWLMCGQFDHNRHPGVLVSFILTSICVALLMIQPDLGQSITVIIGWSAVYFAAGASIPMIGLILSITIGCGILAYIQFDHVKARIDAFIESNFGSPDSSGGIAEPMTQVGFSQQAIGNGGIDGTGLGNGVVKWYLPDGHNDFIIAVAAEEFGLIFVLIISLLFLVIGVLTLKRLNQQKDYFMRFAGTGLIITFCAQVFINLAVAVELSPAKGMTLPFISYGGSSLMSVGLTLGLILCFSRQHNKASITE